MAHRLLDQPAIDSQGSLAPFSWVESDPVTGLLDSNDITIVVRSPTPPSWVERDESPQGLPSENKAILVLQPASTPPQTSTVKRSNVNAEMSTIDHSAPSPLESHADPAIVTLRVSPGHNPAETSRAPAPRSWNSSPPLSSPTLDAEVLDICEVENGASEAPMTFSHE